MFSSILVWIFESALGQAILKILWDDLSTYLTAYIAQKKADNAAQISADASVKKLNDAKTGDEVAKASKDALDGF